MGQSTPEPDEERGDTPFHPDIPFRDAKERVVSSFEKRHIEDVLRRAEGMLTEPSRLISIT